MNPSPLPEVHHAIGSSSTECSVLLMERNTINGEDIRAIFRGRSLFAVALEAEVVHGVLVFDIPIEIN